MGFQNDHYSEECKPRANISMFEYCALSIKL
ncbi:hypothetical protein LCGC14_2569990, partial [marine sediment metagenome]